jgi:hypothetical protein
MPAPIQVILKYHFNAPSGAKQLLGKLQTRLSDTQ